MERIMGLDVGDKTIGVAVSDPLGITAQGITTINRKNLEEDIYKIKELVEKYNVETIVVGLPKNMNNTIGLQGEKVLKFADLIREKIDCNIVLQDERLTTVSAEKSLIQADISRKKRKKVIDKVAATYILQLYLEKNR
ncbi:Holliday junction resolvase RuvX [Thermohalobacter berrensis]|uniref:Putative pre-16S rRNA nuclease n=1 Tax=Thermohalobacter berrensis TaxID=99594 RepID=A0A419TAX3_9FIRM|nr:Holliday junction resolvase RuvX [Thermohalobacter berrensis]RKD34613.1 Holliday junction DNA helicase RuvA [Thermohalobacter berrensis]